jgi:hypothetical protein
MACAADSFLLRLTPTALEKDIIIKNVPVVNINGVTMPDIPKEILNSSLSVYMVEYANKDAKKSKTCTLHLRIEKSKEASIKKAIAKISKITVTDK